MMRVRQQFVAPAHLAALLMFATIAAVGKPAPASAAEEEHPVLTFIEADQLEYRVSDGGDTLRWEAQGWIGGDYQKLWVKTQGDDLSDGPMTEVEVQLLYSRTITAYWDLQAGARWDPRPRPSRSLAVLGIQGLAPYFFEVDAAAFVSDEGGLSARLEVEYELLLTQRLIAKPSVELNFALQEVRDLGIGSGLNDVELGLRLRYDIVREIAPSIGVSWERKMGRTAHLAQRQGKDVSNLSFVAGIRFWY